MDFLPASSPSPGPDRSCIRSSANGAKRRRFREPTISSQSFRQIAASGNAPVSLWAHRPRCSPGPSACPTPGSWRTVSSRREVQPTGPPSGGSLKPRLCACSTATALLEATARRGSGRLTARSARPELDDPSTRLGTTLSKCATNPRPNRRRYRFPPGHDPGATTSLSPLSRRQGRRTHPAGGGDVGQAAQRAAVTEIKMGSFKVMVRRPSRSRP